MARTALCLLIACSLICAPAMAAAADAPAEPEVAEVAAPAAGPLDDLGRPFPNPELVLRARQWTAGGVVMTAVGGALMLTGLTVGSGVARGELQLPGRSIGLDLAENPDNATLIDGAIFIGTTLLSGMILALVGVPMLSAGTFTTKQLDRTIKGAEKVPRTVANEGAYWRGVIQQQYGQAFSIAGGAGVAFGILSIVAVAVTIDTEAYDPELWFALLPGFGMAGAFLPAGLLLVRDGKALQKQTWDAVDPRRQSMFQPGIPLPMVSMSQAGNERAPIVGWAWSGRF